MSEHWFIGWTDPVQRTDCIGPILSVPKGFHLISDCLQWRLLITFERWSHLALSRFVSTQFYSIIYPVFSIELYQLLLIFSISTLQSPLNRVNFKRSDASLEETCFLGRVSGANTHSQTLSLPEQSINCISDEITFSKNFLKTLIWWTVVCRFSSTIINRLILVLKESFS